MTLMRTTPEETEELGRRLTQRLNASIGPTTLLIPLKGVSALSVEGGPFADLVADEALFTAIRAGVDADRIELVEFACDINAPQFADRAVSAIVTNMVRSGLAVG